MSEPRSETFSVREASREYRVGRDFLYAEVHAGRLPHIKLGHRVVLVRPTFEAWLERRSEEANGR
jgi:excisionase family DNA binding protein